jgi:light-regulated signal transduction histidine kinase (bacteriophytochrome)
VKELPQASADQNMIRQVWHNLISNALKYSGKAENPAVEIGSFLQDNNVCYYVKDNGVGFNMQYVDKLFGVFQRLHTNEEFEGTGVGLALTKRIIDRHDGLVWAEGVLNHGATFYFSLPQITSNGRSS